MTACVKIFHCGKNDQEMTVITLLTFIEWLKKVKQNQDSDEDTHKFELRERNARKRSTIQMKIDASEFLETKGFWIKGWTRYPPEADWMILVVQFFHG